MICMALFLLSLYLDSVHPLQFGFKKNISRSSALFTLTEAVMYCSNLSSKVYSAFSNASKAFDKVLHNGLFLKLIKRNVPIGFVKLLKNWYSRLSCMVRWSGKLGTAFPILWGFVRRSSRGNIITIVCHLCR